jgi:hypothetical protein
VFKTDRGSEWLRTFVESAPFNLTKKVDALISDVESLFTQHLEGGDRQRAMKRLRVPPFEEKVFLFSHDISETNLIFFLSNSKVHGPHFGWDCLSA